MHRTSRPVAASKRSPRPRALSWAMPEAATNSPQTLRRGKRAFSSTTTARPARARRAAAMAPAGPPPITSASQRIAPRHEDMAERPRRLLFELPSAAWPEARKLIVGKSGAHADHRVVARDVVAAQRPEEATAKQGELRAARLAGDEDARAPRDEREQARKALGLEVMQKEIGHHGVEHRAGLRKKMEDVHRGEVGAPPERGKGVDRDAMHGRRAVYQRQPDIGPAQPPGDAQRK